jgi:hypothetical protein
LAAPFGQDAGISRTIELNQKPYRVIGVMGPEFRWPASVDLWVPLGIPPTSLSSPTASMKATTRMPAPAGRQFSASQRGVKIPTWVQNNGTAAAPMP